MTEDQNPSESGKNAMLKMAARTLLVFLLATFLARARDSKSPFKHLLPVFEGSGRLSVAAFMIILRSC